MNEIDWKVVAEAISNESFEDVKPEIWANVANYINRNLIPTKIGRRPKPKAPKFNPEISMHENEKNIFKYLSKYQEWKATTNMVTAMDMYSEIDTRYGALIEQGISKGKAKKMVADDLGEKYGMVLTAKSIEAVLTAINAYQKSIREIEESETEITSKKLPTE